MRQDAWGIFNLARSSISLSNPPLLRCPAEVNDELERPRDEEEEEGRAEDRAEERRRQERLNFLHLGNEYESWRQDQELLRRRGREGGRGAFNPRTIIFYPFLLRPSVKAQLLHFYCVEQMRR